MATIEAEKPQGSPPPSSEDSTSGGIFSDRNLHLFFLAASILTIMIFARWGLDYIGADASVPIFMIATAFGVFMAFNIGGNDVANSFGTSVGAGTLTIKQALLVAAIFEVSGAVIAGGEVTSTIRKGIVSLDVGTVNPNDFMFIMMSALFAAAGWLLFATKMGYPVSTTHSIIGGIVGAAVTMGYIAGGDVSPWSVVKWDKVGQIAMSWVLSPVLGGIVGFLLYSWVKKSILQYNDRADAILKEVKAERLASRDRHLEEFDRLTELQQISYTSALARDAAVMTKGDYTKDDLESDYQKEMFEIEQKTNKLDAHRALENWVPALASGGAMLITAMLLFKGLKHMELGLSNAQNYLIIGMVGAAIWMGTLIFAKTLKKESLSRSTFLLFSWMQVFTAAGFAFSHGSNDIANAIGPFAAILDVLRTGEVGKEAAVPGAAMLTFGIALVVGLWFIGRNVIKTVGTNLTKMHPASGFSAELSAAGVVMMASAMGLPVSSTHILIGAVLGIGIANKSTNWGLMRPIALAWVITLPAAGLLASLAFVVLRSMF